MAQAPWNVKFEKILRQVLPGVGDNDPIDAAVPMSAYGLDSMALIQIVSALESAWGVSLAGQLAVPVRSLTAGHLWGIVVAAQQPAWGSQRPSTGGATRAQPPWIMA
ncbi:acyl carrier protein [Streptomyces sp. N35]|uniref:acyl carrier protein n=1 Tax=Streptomyces sp. N35 TaxID=2795730 RepID=UPI0018F4AE29|nr:acyl carrier protein [Streptomyces sp. N35]